MDLKTLNQLMNEIEHLKKSHALLQEVCHHLNPYDHQINGNDAGRLVREIHEHLYNFDDSE